MGPFGHREPFRFAEPNENSSFSERSPVIFSTKLEKIQNYKFEYGKGSL
jgi:hypothetical protein